MGAHGAGAALFSCRNKTMRGISAALDTRQTWWGTSEPREKRKSSDFKIVYHCCCHPRKHDVVALLTHPLQGRAVVLRSELCLLPLPQRAFPSLAPAREWWEESRGWLLWLKPTLDNEQIKFGHLCGFHAW